MGWEVQWRAGLYLPQIDLWSDAHWPKRRCFVSHAHSDHTAAHDEIICSEPTARLMRARTPGERVERILGYEEPMELDSGEVLKLYPAGHILGSSQLWVERKGESLLYTGDFKLRPGLSAEPCATPRADVLIMETTFGMPRYSFPPTEKVLSDIVHFCRQAIEDGEVPVLFGYSLGKSQEIIRSLAGAGLPIMLHSQVHKLTRIYDAMGIEFPAYESFSLENVAGHVVICPPQSNNSSWLRKIKPRRTAAITGWAMDPNAIYRYQCDAAFPLSDHADYPDLLAFVEKVQPRQVLTVHGFTREFAQTLRERGIEAWALGMENQLEMSLSMVSPVPGLTIPSPEEPALDQAAGENNPGEFREFARVGERIRGTAGKLQKVEFLRNYFVGLTDDQLAAAAVYFTGKPFAQADARVLQSGWAVIKGALLKVAGINEGEYRAVYQRFSDSGETAQEILTSRTQPEPWMMETAGDFFDGLQARRGPLEKREWLEQRLRKMTPVEAKYLIKIITGDLRIGLKEGLVEEGLAAATGREVEEIREANMLTGDLGTVARAARAGGLEQLQLQVFHPLQFMLASPEPTAEAIAARMGGSIWLEEKYDGIRCQVHKQGDRVELYSRELRKITGQFPELALAASKVKADFIADGELLAWKEGRALPFAELQKRLGRKGDDFFLGAEIPVSLTFYDLLWAEGDNLLKRPLSERRARLEAIEMVPGLFVAPMQKVNGPEEIEAAFLRARERGNEGLMAKDPLSVYTPGRRGLAWLKLKKAYATLDVVVVGVELGHGKRKSELSDYTFAVRDESTGLLRTVGKAYSGLTDVEIARLTEHFIANTEEDMGRYRRVTPNVVLEIAFDSIQASRRHDSGYALRFPRILRIRDDKTPQEIDTVAFCRKLAGDDVVTLL